MRRSIGLGLALLASGCARVGPGVTGVVDLAPREEDALEVVYLGTGGLILRHGDDTVLTGPFFSNPGLFRVGLAEIRSDTLAVDRGMESHDVAEASLILVGHAHYDHLMDVPRVARRHAPAARIMGSRTMANTLGTWSGLASRVDVVDQEAGDLETPGRWRSYGRVRVMPLRSRHAPHFEGHTLYSGTRSRPLAREPRWAGEWLDGETLSFLIDFLDDEGAVAHRVFYQDAVAPPPAGFVPRAVIAERSVDVAIILPATFDQVDWHPEALVENLDPARIVLAHWEDFFTTIGDDPSRSLLLADQAHFEERLARVFSGPYWRPEIGTVFRFPRGDRHRTGSP